MLMTLSRQLAAHDWLCSRVHLQAGEGVAGFWYRCQNRPDESMDSARPAGLDLPGNSVGDKETIRRLFKTMLHRNLMSTYLNIDNRLEYRTSKDVEHNFDIGISGVAFLKQFLKLLNIYEERREEDKEF